jgi:hypothetical protein
MPCKAILAGAMLAAGLTSTACAPGGDVVASAGPGAGSPAPVRSPSCLQQYRVWGSGPEHAAGENLTAALNGLQAASSASDIPATSAALKRAGMAARTLEHYPIPACADPQGYWHAVLLRIEAAADHAGTSNGQAALALAGGVLRQLPVLERKLATELKGTVPGLGQNQ